MRNRILTLASLVTLAACAGGSDKPAADSLQRDLSLAPAESSAALNDAPAAAPASQPATQPATPPAPRPRPAAKPSLAAGATFATASLDSLNSRHDHAGGTLRVRVSADVKDAAGRTVIPAGAVVSLHVDSLAPAENDQDKTGKLKLTPVAVEIGGTSHPLSATVDSVHYKIVGRGVTAGDAAKVGAGAAVGAAAGRLLGGSRRSTIVGGVVGAAAGAAAASQTNDRDVVIVPGDYIRIRLAGAFGL